MRLLKPLTALIKVWLAVTFPKHHSHIKRNQVVNLNKKAS